MDYKFDKAEIGQLDEIWEIIKCAINRRKQDGSNQWQDGYPNQSIIEHDIKQGYAYVIFNDSDIIGYCAILNEEPEYAKIQGKWLTNSDFLVFHRVAIAEKYLRQGFSKAMLRFIESLAVDKNIFSIKADTNFDNEAMLTLFERSGYTYCGEVSFRGSPRKAFEKVLKAVNY